MKRLRLLPLVGLAVVICLFIAGRSVPGAGLKGGPDSFVVEIIKQFGYNPPSHFIDYDSTMVRQGRELVFTGITRDSTGKKTTIQSKYFQCTHCHNTEREDPDLVTKSPGARLKYAIEKELPFLPGTTLYGTVNKEKWYSGDYVKKYGDLATEANFDLRKAIQVCAKECSQGRYLEEWELNAMLAYLQTIGLKMKDLKMSRADWRTIHMDGETKDYKKETVLSKFSTVALSRFGEKPEDIEKGYGMNGNPSNGEKIFELACMHCHAPEGITFLKLSKDRYTMKMLKKNLTKHTDMNLYQVVRHGTEAEVGGAAYMPLFSIDRMSDQQVEDLRAYIEKMAKKK